MKLILLESRNQYDQKVLHGVFSSREEAEQAILSVQAALSEAFLMNASDKSKTQMEKLRVVSKQINQHKVLSFDDWAWINYSRPPKVYFTFTEISLDEVVCT